MAKKSKKSGNGKIILVVALLGAALYYMYNQAMKISVTGGFFRIHKLQGTSLELRVFLTLTNEANSAVDVQRFLGQLLYKGSNIGTVSLVRPETIPSFETKDIEFKTLVSLTSVGMELYNIIKNKVNFNPQDIRIKGTLKAEGITMPIDEALISA